VAKVLTTPDVAKAAGVSDQTIRRWGAAGLLPTPVKAFRGRRGTVSQWPEGTIEQARWVLAELEAGLTFPQILAALEAGEYRVAKAKP
jgi:DNA-binding transcriptional MerR regulator